MVFPNFMMTVLTNFRLKKLWVEDVVMARSGSFWMCVRASSNAWYHVCADIIANTRELFWIHTLPGSSQVTRLGVSVPGRKVLTHKYLVQMQPILIWMVRKQDVTPVYRQK